MNLYIINLLFPRFSILQDEEILGKYRKQIVGDMKYFLKNNATRGETFSDEQLI